jgi:hypothetical protein
LVASSTTSAAPIWSTVALAAAALVFVAMTVGLLLVKDNGIERRLFWSGFFVTLVLAAIAVLHRGLATSVAVFVAGAFVIALYAYLRTDYLRIGGKVYNVWTLIRRNR